MVSAFFLRWNLDKSLVWKCMIGTSGSARNATISDWSRLWKMEAPNEVKIILWRPSHNKSTTFLDLKRSNERRRIENLIHPYPVCGIVRWWSFTSATIWSLVLQPYVGGVNGCACGSYISAEHIIRHMTDLETLLTVNASQMASLKNRTFFFCLLSLGLKGCSWDAAVKWTEIGS